MSEHNRKLSGSARQRDKQHEVTADELIESCLVMRKGVAAVIILAALFLFLIKSYFCSKMKLMNQLGNLQVKGRWLPALRPSCRTVTFF